MRTMIIVLGSAALLAGTLLWQAADQAALLIGVVLLLMTLLFAWIAWENDFGALVAAACSAAALSGLAIFQFVYQRLFWNETLAFALSLMLVAGLLSLLLRIWIAAIEVKPIEVLVLRDRNTQAYQVVRGPTRVARLPWREPFAKLPTIPAEWTYALTRIDLLPPLHDGMAAGLRIEGLRVELHVQIDPADAFRIFYAPSWPMYLQGANADMPIALTFPQLMISHDAWMHVLRCLVEQQVELTVRRAARERGLSPYQLHIEREQFAHHVESLLAETLSKLGIILHSFDILQVDLVDAQDFARLNLQQLQFQVMALELRRMGLPVSPDTLLLGALLFGDGNHHLSLLHSSGGAAATIPLLMREHGS